MATTLKQQVLSSCVHVPAQVQELRKQAAELGLETKGTKAELLARVEKYLKEQGAGSVRACERFR